MATFLLCNNATTAIPVGIGSPTANTATVSGSTSYGRGLGQFPSSLATGQQIAALIDSEIVYITAINSATNVFTLLRGQEGTTATTHGTTATLSAVLTAGVQAAALQLPSTKSVLGSAPDASASYGLLNLGSGPFDGTSAGHFAGTSNGQALAVNLAAGSAADILNGQVGGVGRVRIDAYGHLLSTAPAPASVAAAAGVPAGNTFSLWTSPTASDVRGTIQLVTGTTPPSAGQLCTVTFANAFPSQPIVLAVFTGGTVPSGAVAYPYTAGTTTFTLAYGGTALAASTTYYINYVVIG